MKQFIKEKLVEMHKTVSTDKYGQVSKSNYTFGVFGERGDEVKEWCDRNKGVLSVSTYRWQYGTYKAFTIIDQEIRKACTKALVNNENYRRNINSY